MAGVAVLAGGVGAARLLRGLVDVVPPEDVTAIVNTGDDTVLHGLAISPDIDTVTYTLADAIDPERGWGLRDESWHAMEALSRYGGATWFRLGDRDLATHLYRTQRLAEGAGLAAVTAEIAAAWGLRLRILPATEPAFDIHFDSAPTFYVSGDASHPIGPPRTDPAVRQLERDVWNATAPDPYAGTGSPVKIAEALADPVEEKALHMINADPKRTPTFTMFGNPDFFFQTTNLSGGCSGSIVCANPGFAWNHGDIQQEIANTWVGMVGPGVSSGGLDSTTWTDHTNVRPTMMALLGLKDDYVQDGRVLIEALTTDATPQSLIAAHLTEPPPRTGHAELDRVIARAMAKRRADRHPSAGDLGRAALAAATGERLAYEERSVATGDAAALDELDDVTVPTPQPRARHRRPLAIAAPV